MKSFSKLKYLIIFIIYFGIVFLNVYNIPSITINENLIESNQKEVSLQSGSKSYLFNWSDIWGGPNADYQHGGIAVNDNGYIYITGSTSSFGSGGYDTFIIKYDPCGNKTWIRFWGGSDHENPHDITSDSSGNIYITGEYCDISGAPSYLFLLKYDSNGNYQWHSLWGYSIWNEGFGVAVNTLGDVYVTGRTGNVFALLKYNSIGSLVWSKINASLSVGHDIAIGNSEDLYIIGKFDDQVNVFLSKYDYNGILIWNRVWGGSEPEWASCIAVNRSGDIYFTGQTYSYGEGSCDVFIVNYDSAGDMKWNKTWGTSQSETGFGITLDDYGDIYLTGEITTEYMDQDTLILKFNHEGNLIWEGKWGGFGCESGNRIALDKEGSIYVTGSIWNYGAGDHDVFLIKYISEVSIPKDNFVISGYSIGYLYLFQLTFIIVIMLFLFKMRKFNFK